MKLDELRAVLNEMRVCPIWRKIMREQQADMALLMDHIRTELADARRLDEAGSVLEFAIKCRSILHYCEHDRWLHAKEFQKRRPPEDGNPEHEIEAEGIATWLAFLKSFNPDKTYGQCTFLFHERFGYWPKWRWPGMPKDRRNMGRRIKYLRPDELWPVPLALADLLGDVKRALWDKM